MRGARSGAYPLLIITQEAFGLICGSFGPIFIGAIYHAIAPIDGKALWCGTIAAITKSAGLPTAMTVRGLIGLITLSARDIRSFAIRGDPSQVSLTNSTGPKQRGTEGRGALIGSAGAARERPIFGGRDREGARLALQVP